MGSTVAKPAIQSNKEKSDLIDLMLKKKLKLRKKKNILNQNERIQLDAVE